MKIRLADKTELEMWIGSEGITLEHPEAKAFSVFWKFEFLWNPRTIVSADAWRCPRCGSDWTCIRGASKSFYCEGCGFTLRMPKALPTP